MKVLAVIKRSPGIFALALVATLATLLISETSYVRSVNELNDLDASTTARVNIRNLARSIVDAETGQRGYLLTGRQDYLQPYDEAVNTIDQSFVTLRAYYAARPEKIATLDKLQLLKDTKLSEIQLTIDLFKGGKVDAARELILSDIGKEKMDTIRALSSEMLEEERVHFAENRDRMNQTLVTRRVGVALFSVFSLLALFMYMRQTYKLARQKEEVQRLIQAERDRLEIEVKQRTAQLSELTHHLLTAREDERSRLARNLHDELGALLTSAKLDAARIKSRLADKAPEALELLAHLVGTLNSGIALGRGIIENLRPSALGNLGLVATLEILTREFAEQSGIMVDCALEPVKLNPAAELMAYRLVQEATTNIAKYAHATHVGISLATRDGQVEISVRDNGIGFDSTVAPKSAYGLAGMRFRVETEGGTLTIQSALGAGTQLVARLPESALTSIDETTRA
jgi:signal transduction histidine kinase